MHVVQPAKSTDSEPNGVDRQRTAWTVALPGRNLCECFIFPNKDIMRSSTAIDCPHPLPGFIFLYAMSWLWQNRLKLTLVVVEVGVPSKELVIQYYEVYFPMALVCIGCMEYFIHAQKHGDTGVFRISTKYFSF